MVRTATVGGFINIMKCKNELCDNKAAKNQIYCSRNCAPYGNFGRNQESSIDSTKLEKYSTMANGEAFFRASNEESRAPVVIFKDTEILLKEENTSQRLPESGGLLEKIESTQIVEKNIGDLQILKEEDRTKLAQTLEEKMLEQRKNSEQDIGPRENQDLKKSSNTEIESTPPAMLSVPLLSSEEVKLASLSLIDDALTRLHWQMQRVTLRGIEDAAPFDKSNFEIKRGNLVCETAGAIAKLVRLKVDALKAFKDLR